MPRCQISHFTRSAHSAQSPFQSNVLRSQHHSHSAGLSSMEACHIKGSNVPHPRYRVCVNFRKYPHFMPLREVTLRKADIEMLEVRLEPLQTARDRHESEINSMKRAMEEMRSKYKDLKRDRDAHSTSIEQGLASIRSLLQRANRAAREQGIIEDDPEPQPIDNAAPAPHHVRQRGNRLVL